MINGDILKTLLKQARLGWEDFAETIGREPEVVRAWLNDMDSIPPYIGLTVLGIRRKLTPCDDDEMLAADLATVLGINAEQARYWKGTLQFPQAARFALATTFNDQQRETPLSASDRDILRRLHYSPHWRVRNGWRARPVMGKALPKMGLATPRRVIQLGLAEVIGSGPKPRLQLTPAGKDRILK